jgi:hypothetical protein
MAMAGEDLKTGVVKAREEVGKSVRRVGRKEVVGRIVMVCWLIAKGLFIEAPVWSLRMGMEGVRGRYGRWC